MANRLAMKRKEGYFKEASLIAEDVKQSAVLRYLTTIDPTARQTSDLGHAEKDFNQLNFRVKGENTRTRHLLGR